VIGFGEGFAGLHASRVHPGRHPPRVQ